MPCKCIRLAQHGIEMCEISEHSEVAVGWRRLLPARIPCLSAGKTRMSKSIALDRVRQCGMLLGMSRILYVMDKEISYLP